MAELQSLAIIGAAIATGIGWNLVGIWDQFKQTGSKAVDWLAIRKNALIGTGTGVVAWGLAVTNKIDVGPITSPETFVIACSTLFPVIVLADKLLSRKAKEKLATPTQ